MIRIETEIFISKTPQEIWNCLVDFEKYPIWNPFIVAIKGENYKGAKIKLQIAKPQISCSQNEKTNKLSAKLIILEENKMLAIKGKIGLDALLGGVLFIRLTPTKNGTLLSHGINISGVLLPLFEKRLKETLPQQLNNTNIKLAKYLGA